MVGIPDIVKGGHLNGWSRSSVREKSGPYHIFRGEALMFCEKLLDEEKKIEEREKCLL